MGEMYSVHRAKMMLVEMEIEGLIGTADLVVHWDLVDEEASAEVARLAGVSDAAYRAWDRMEGRAGATDAECARLWEAFDAADRAWRQAWRAYNRGA